MHVIDVAETTLTLVHAEPPTVTVEPFAKFVPVIVINVPPADEPEVGDTAVTVGKDPTVKETVLVILPQALLLKTRLTVYDPAWVGVPSIVAGRVQPI